METPAQNGVTGAQDDLARAQRDVERVSQRIEAARRVLLRLAAVLVGFLGILLGGMLTLFAAPAFFEWPALTVALRATVLLWLITGPMVLVCGVWSLVSLGRHRMPQWIGAAAIIPAGAVMIVGVLTHFIPCAGPT
jgi:hypothetical protein